MRRKKQNEEQREGSLQGVIITDEKIQRQEKKMPVRVITVRHLAVRRIA